MRTIRVPRSIKNNAHILGFLLMIAAGLVAFMDFLYPEEGYLPAELQLQSESRQKRSLDVMIQAPVDEEPERDDPYDRDLAWFDYSSSDGNPQPIESDQVLKNVDPYVPKFDIPITRRVDPNIKSKLIVYNSVPKSGSSLFRSLIEKMSSKNNFRYLMGFTDLLQKRFITNLEEDVLSRTLLNTATPALYTKQVFYVNFTKFGYIQPTYISLIRDPTLSKISRYYHSKGGHEKGTATRNKTLEECMQKGEPECTFNAKVMISRNPEPPDYSAEVKIEGLLPYFCGNEYKCRMAYSLWTLQRAKESVERNYAVVGTLENFEGFLKVLAHKFPTFFNGIYETYKSSGPQQEDKTRSLITEPGYNILKKRLHLEYEFYDFIAQRLSKQLQEMS